MPKSLAQMIYEARMAEHRENLLRRRIARRIKAINGSFIIEQIADRDGDLRITRLLAQDIIQSPRWRYRS